MNENVLDVLLYLFENFSLPDIETGANVRDDLGEAGFFDDEIDDAFDWLSATAVTGVRDSPRPAPMRCGSMPGPNCWCWIPSVAVSLPISSTSAC